MGEQTNDGPFSGFQCVSLALAVHGTLFFYSATPDVCKLVELMGLFNSML